VLQGLYLVDYGFGNFRVCVADTDGQHATEAVEVLVALIIPNVKTLTPHNRDRLLVIGRDCREEKLFVLADGFGGGDFGFCGAHDYSKTS
jgi:hypothetical protein